MYESGDETFNIPGPAVRITLTRNNGERYLIFLSTFISSPLPLNFVVVIHLFVNDFFVLLAFLNTKSN
jgi:hypothetical protein